MNSMKRRAFLSGLTVTATSLILPYEPERIYSFVTPILRAPTLRFYSGINLQTPLVARARDCILEIPLAKVQGQWCGVEFITSLLQVKYEAFCMLHDAEGKSISEITNSIRGATLFRGDSLSVSIPPNDLLLNTMLDAAT